MAKDHPTNGRHHDPSLRELTAELDGLRDLFLAKMENSREILDERDRLYKERDDARRTAVDAALTAVKDQTKASFEASEKAIVKAEDAQRTYNQGHNDLSRKMDDQYKAMVPQSEARLKWDGVDKSVDDVRRDVVMARDERQREIAGLREQLMKEIASLRESRSEGAGRQSQHFEGRQYSQWAISAGIAFAGICASIAYVVVHVIKP